MTISVLQEAGARFDNATNPTQAFSSNVQVGSLIVVEAWRDYGATDPFVSGDVTKSAGTATLSAFQLDKTLETNDAGEFTGVGVWSAVVTGAGSCTIQLAVSTTYGGLAIGEYGGSWDASRVEDSDQGSSTTDSQSSAATGAMTSAGAALFIGALAVYGSGNLTPLAPDSPWTTIAAEPDNTAHAAGSAIRQVAGSGTTDAAGWTFLNDNRSWSAVGVVYKEASSATADQEGARFGNDDGNEAAHTFAAAQDANVTAPLGQNLLIRALIDGTGDLASTAYTLRYQKNGSGGYAPVPVGATTSPTIGTVVAGAFAYSATNPAAPYPAGIAAGDALVLLVGQKPSSANGGTVTTPSGWTLRKEISGATDGNTGGYTTTLGADTGNCNIYAYTKDTVDGTETGNLTVTTGTNNVAWAIIILVPKTAAGTWSIAADGGKDTSAGNVSIASAAGMAVQAGDLLIGAMVIPTDVTTPAQFSAEAFTQSGTTFGSATEIGEADNTTNNDIGGFVFSQAASSGSGSGVVTMSATAGGTTTNVRGPGVILRLRPVGVANEIYVAPSSNITAGGEATTARLTAPSGKSTSDFVTGRRWDDENGSDATDVTTDDYTELEWCLQAQAPAANGDFFDLRVYAGASALASYTVTPRWTIGTPVPAFAAPTRATLLPGRGPFHPLAPFKTRYGERAVGATVVAIGQVVETDTAQAIARVKAKTLGQTSETDTAQAVTRVKSRVLGQVAETDAAQPFAHAKVKAIGQNTETDTAQTLTRVKSRTLGQPSETDTAQAIARLKSRVLGQATETDTAQSIIRSGTATPIGQATETDTAQALTRLKSRTLGQVAETGTAQPVAHSKVLALAQVLETDAAQSIARLKTRLLGQPSETDTAQAVAHSKLKLLGQAAEDDLAFPIVRAGAAPPAGPFVRRPRNPRKWLRRG